MRAWVGRRATALGLVLLSGFLTNSIAPTAAEAAPLSGSASAREVVPGYYDIALRIKDSTVSHGVGLGCISLRVNTKTDGTGVTPPGMDLSQASNDYNSFIS